MIAMSASIAASAGSVTGATITGLGMNPGSGSVVWVSVNVSKSSNPACSTNSTWGFVLPLTTTLENQFLALLVSARATQTPVSLSGNGLCDTFGGIETLVNIVY
jgi:hypothetical protein